MRLTLEARAWPPSSRCSMPPARRWRVCTLCGVNLPCISVSRTAPMRCLVIMYYLLVRSNRMLLFDDNIGACRHAHPVPYNLAVQ